MSIEAAQLRLLSWFSPAFPTGAFGYSHGLESAIRDGLVADAQDLAAWIDGLVEQGSGWTDAVLFRAAWGAQSPDELTDIADLALALAPSLERRRESLGQGAAFLKAVAVWAGNDTRALHGPNALSVAEDRICRWLPVRHPGRSAAGSRDDGPFHMRSPCPEGEDQVPYCVAAGAACAAAGVPLQAALVAWLHAFAANLVSVALRAVPLGQTDGVATMAALEPVLLAVAERAAGATLDDLGGCALVSDIAAMRHETLQPRLFIS